MTPNTVCVRIAEQVADESKRRGHLDESRQIATIDECYHEGDGWVLAAIAAVLIALAVAVR